MKRPNPLDVYATLETIDTHQRSIIAQRQAIDAALATLTERERTLDTLLAQCVQNIEWFARLTMAERTPELEAALAHARDRTSRPGCVYAPETTAAIRALVALVVPSPRNDAA